MPCVRALLFALVVLAGLAHAGVTVVPANELQAAVDAAAEGDILLVQTGQFVFGANEVVIDGKSLTIVAQAPGVEMQHLFVLNLAAEQRVVVRGLTLDLGQFGIAPLQEAMVDVRDCAGAVWLDRCSVLAPPAKHFGLFGSVQMGIHGLSATNSARVVATDCVITGGDGALGECTCILCCGPGTPGGDGVFAAGSDVALLGCSISAGPGGGPNPFLGTGAAQASGRGVHLEGAAFVHLAGSDVHGGSDQPWNLGPGAGLHLADAASLAELRDCLVAAGFGDPPAPDIDTAFPNVNLLPAPARGLDVTSPLHVDAPGQLTISALPGDLVAVFHAPLPGWLPLPAKQGVLLLEGFSTPLVVGVAPGEWTIGILGPHALPPGVLGFTALLQLVVKDGSKLLLEDVATCTLLDASLP